MTTRPLLFSIALLVFLPGCPKPPAASTYCPASFCAGHGTCVNSNTVPACTCDDGYAGLTCGICAPGFHRTGNDTCAGDDICSAGLCGDHGTCSVTASVASCTCDPGYTGALCDGCAQGFFFVPTIPDGGTLDAGSTGSGIADAGSTNDGGASLPSAVADAGTIPGICVRQQACSPSACLPNWSCDDTSGVVVCTCRSANCSACNAGTCNGHGTCDDSSGNAVCTSCDPGYTGSACDTCHSGYSELDGGTCVLNEVCTAQTCSGGGSCSVVNGVATCTCRAAYAGDSCESCADGYHRASDGSCAANETCASNSCSPTETCDDSTGVIACTCAAGYAGSGCQLCYPGYHEVPVDGGMGGLGQGVVCVVDEQCTQTSCGTGICDDSTGAVTCTCPAGTSGNYCEIAPDACGTPPPCGTGQCLNLGTTYECLCTDGTWGMSCLPAPTITSVAPPSGAIAGGTMVVLTGTGFDPSATLSFAGSAVASITVVSATEIDFMTPAGAHTGSVDIEVMNPNGEVAHASYSFLPASFTATGANQTFTIPTGVTTLFVQAWGAGGGAGQDPSSVGGAGGYAQAHLSVTPGDVYTIVVGKGGEQVSAAESFDAGSGVSVDAGTASAAGAGGGFSGLFVPGADAGMDGGSEVVLVLAGGGGGAGYASGDNGGNGGGEFGGAGGSANSSAGLGGNNAAGGIGGCLCTDPADGGAGCLTSPQCGLNGSLLQGGGGGVPALGTPRVDGSFGGGGAVGNGPTFNAAGGGGGYFGGGGGAGGGGGGGGGGTGYIFEAALDSDQASGTSPGVTAHTTETGFIMGTAAGGSAMTPTGGDGLVLLSW